VNEQNSWTITDFSKPPEIWNFLAPANKNVQVVSFDGTYVLAGVPYELQSVKTSQQMLVLNPTKPLFSVTIDPSQIEWVAGNFTQVVVTLYTKDATGNLLYPNTLTPFHSDNNLTQLYPYYVDAGQTPECFYKAEYWVKDQPAPALIPETSLKATAQLTLPGKPPAAALAAATQRALALRRR
jgi:hypothetical protein